MSIEAINWAMRQRLRGCAPQCLLFVLANAADPEGVAFGWWKSSDHWWPYLIKHTRLARATIFGLLREMEEKGLISRDEVAPQDGTHAQWVIRLHFDRLVDEPMPSERPRAVAGESESISWTQETVGDPEKPPPSPPNGLGTEGLAPVAVQPMDSFESTPWTGKESYKENPISSPKPPSSSVVGTAGSAKKDSASSEPEPIGFATFWSEYPDHQLDNRRRAGEEFANLPESDRTKAIDAAGLYARDIRDRKRKPVAAFRWLRERRFSEYSPGAGRTGSGKVFVPEASEAWQAWCAVGAVAYGCEPKIPTLWAGRGPRNERGANCPAAWPLGGEGWLVPYAEWVFVARGSAQCGRWVERVGEMLGRAPVLRGSSRARHDRRRLIDPQYASWDDLPKTAGGPLDIQGLLVPSEWPPAKGARKVGGSTGAGASLMTDADSEALQHL